MTEDKEYVALEEILPMALLEDDYEEFFADGDCTVERWSLFETTHPDKAKEARSIIQSHLGRLLKELMSETVIRNLKHKGADARTIAKAKVYAEASRICWE